MKRRLSKQEVPIRKCNTVTVTIYKPLKQKPDIYFFQLHILQEVMIVNITILSRNHNRNENE